MLWAMDYQYTGKIVTNIHWNNNYGDNGERNYAPQLPGPWSYIITLTHGEDDTSSPQSISVQPLTGFSPRNGSAPYILIRPCLASGRVTVGE